MNKGSFKWIGVFCLCFFITKFVIPKVYTSKDVKVIDGDTIELPSGKQIDLWGIVAPNTRTKLGGESKRALEIIVQDKRIKCKDKTGPIRVGATAAICTYYDKEYKEEIDIAGAMIQVGYAIDLYIQSQGYYKEAMLQALDEEVGMWKMILEEYTKEQILKGNIEI